MKKILIPPFFVFAAFLLIVLFYFLFPKLILIPFPLNWFGIIISFYGITIMGKARDLFKKYDTTLDFEKSSHLIDEGVFSKSRNPMYSGMFLLLLGISVCFGNIISIFIAFVFFVLIRLLFISVEERMMEETFGKQYLEYRMKTRMYF